MLDLTILLLLYIHEEINSDLIVNKRSGAMWRISINMSFCLIHAFGFIKLNIWPC